MPLLYKLSKEKALNTIQTLDKFVGGNRAGQGALTPALARSVSALVWSSPIGTYFDHRIYCIRADVMGLISSFLNSKKSLLTLRLSMLI